MSNNLVPKMTIEDGYAGYGREDFVLTIDDLAALYQGKALSGDVAEGEYGITISFDDELLKIESLTRLYTDMVLEHIKAEIDKQEFTHHAGLTHWYMIPSEVKSIVYEIIDKHISGKEQN